MDDSAGGFLAEFISEKALADQLGHHEATVRRWRKERRGPRFTLNGRTVLYHPDDVNEWLRAGGVANVRRPAKRRRKGRAKR